MALNKLINQLKTPSKPNETNEFTITNHNTGKEITKNTHLTDVDIIKVCTNDDNTTEDCTECGVRTDLDNTQHDFRCKYSTKCTECGVRTDLPNTCHDGKCSHSTYNT